MMIRKYVSTAAAAIACLAASIASAGDIVPPPITVSCIPPLLWRTTRCECQDGSLPVYVMSPYPQCPGRPTATFACELKLVYYSTQPASPALLVDANPACDDMLEQALAAVLAKRLGAP